MSKKNILIAGAGPVGSLLGIYLARAGHQVKIFERRPDMRRHEIPAGRSINLACSDRGFRAMADAGIADQVREVAIPMYGRVMHSVAGELTMQPYGKSDQAIYAISRSGINEELINGADAFDNVSFSFDERCVHVDLDKPSATFKNLHTGAETTIEADILIGADGAFSAVRSKMMLRDRFNYSQHYLPHGYKELFIPGNPNGSYKIEKEALHIWPRGDQMLIALPNLDGSFTCTLFMPFKGKEGSFEALGSQEAARAFFQEVYPDALDLMPTFDDDFADNPTSSLVTIRCSPWVHEDKVALIGDASHAIVPFYGQGMNSGLEDCRIFAESLAEGGDDWHQVLQIYQNNRIENANAIAELALRNFIEMRDSVGNPAFLQKKQLEKKLASMFPERFVPTYSMVTFSHTPYAEALKLGDEQEVMLKQMMEKPGLFDDLDTPQTEAFLSETFATWEQRNR